MLRRLLITALGVLAFGPGPAAMAQGGDVEVPLAQATALRIIKDVDTIDVSKTPGRFSGIRVYALDGAAVDIFKIDIVFSDGYVFTEDRGRPIHLDQTDKRTRIIGPSGDKAGERFIDKIVMYYKTAPSEGSRAQVRITGVTSARGARAERSTAMAPSSAPVTGSVSATKTASSPVKARPGQAVSDSAVLFGVKTVGFGRDRDTIPVGREIGKFDKIQLRILNNDIVIREMVLTYAGGATETIIHNATAKANTRTAWFPLQGAQFIDKIDIVYSSTRAGRSGEARVEVYGEYADGWTDEEGEGRKFNRGRIYIGGASPVLFSFKKGLGYERQVLPVARNSKGFKHLFLHVRDRDITLKEIKVNYRDGTSQIVPFGMGLTGETIKVGSEFGPVPLQIKPIKDIEVRYRSQFFSSSRTAGSSPYAFVEFWATY
jgi:hypothetical protein